MNHLAMLLFAAALMSAGGAAAEPASSSKAEAVLAASKGATGGDAWDRSDGCHEQGTHGDGAVRYDTWFSLRHYGMRVESLGGGNSRAMGFNGKLSWRTDEKGVAQVSSDAGALQEAKLTAYLSNNGFFFPQRFPATFRYVRKVTERKSTFDVIEVTPVGSRPAELWFDRRTHFLLRVVDKQANPPQQVEASDYRRVGDLSVAFKLTVLGPDGQPADRGALTSFKCGAVNEGLFDPPK